MAVQSSGADSRNPVSRGDILAHDNRRCMRFILFVGAVTRIHLMAKL